MNLRFRAAIVITTMLMLVGSASVLHAQSATLAWDRNTEPEVTGYRISYGTRTGAYSQTVDVGNVTQYTVNGLDLSLDYYFVVQAYTATGLMSGFSNEALLPAPVPPGTTVINSFTANTGFPVVPGTPVTWTASATSRLGPVEYRFLTYSPATGWAVGQPYSTNPVFTWTPGWGDVGPTHTIQLWARTVGSPAPYEAWISSNTFDVVPRAVQVLADVDFPTPPDNPVHWTAIVAGASALQLEYKFVMLNVTTGVWTIVRDYTPSNQLTWTPTATGNFLVQAWARRVGTTVPYEVWGTSGQFSIARTTPQVTSLTPNVTFPAPTGTPITWTARVRGGMAGPLQYQFYRYSATAGWAVVQPYSTSNTFTWTPVWGQEGQYNLQVWVRNAGSTAPYDAWLGSGAFDITRAPLLVTVNTVFPAPAGTPVTLTAQVPDASVSFEYAFYLYDRGTGTWSVPRTYSTSNSFTWTPTASGTYLFQVWARKVGSTAVYDTWASTPYLTVSSGPAQVLSLKADSTLPAHAGTTITWTAVGAGGTARPLQYKFVKFMEGVGWAVVRDWSASNTYTWTPTAAEVGNHSLQVWVRSAGSTAVYEGWLGSGYFVIQP